jgi:Rod binding domain-containing protein
MTIQPVTSAAAAAPSTGDASKAREAARGFERQLVEQLAQQLVATTKPLTGEENEDSADQSAYRDLLPATLADAVEKGGGVGLSAELERTLRTGSAS